MRAVEIIYRYQADGVPARLPPSDAEAARRRLDEGSRAFASLMGSLSEDGGTASRIIQVDRRDLGLIAPGKSGPRQRPFAAVLGCSDARVPIELIFNEGPNDLFIVRVAGNGLGSEVLGSLRYAAEHLSASVKCIVVLGHSGCGAVSAAVDVFLEPSQYLPLAASHSVRNILDRLLIVVRASAKKLHDTFGSEVIRLPGYREALIEVSIAVNAALAAYTVQEEVGGNGPAGIRAFFGVYLLNTRDIWAPRHGARSSIGLAPPPRDLATFMDLADAAIHSDRIAALLKAERPR
jgi:carbonic anhydrase